MSLKDRIAAEIRAGGPIPVADFMARCLFDPAEGYYTTREPFGAAGDFTTAPEVSQIFGELVAVWLYAAWRAGGAPARVTLAEIGPGRGTLMKDMLRTLAQLDAGFLAGAEICMIEISPRLIETQRETLAENPVAVRWQATLDDLTDRPLLLVGNELFDAIPVRQYVKAAGHWRERAVGLDDQGGLRFQAGAGAIEPSLLPAGASAAPEGAIFESAPAREALAAEAARRIAGNGIAALFFDYGHLVPGCGDTFQAVRGHGFADPLAEPGMADLTAHVDFAALGAAVRAEGSAVKLATQGRFLLAMGVLERAGALGADMDAAGREAIAEAVERLAAPHRMGNLFKAMAITAPGLAVPGFDAG